MLRKSFIILFAALCMTGLSLQAAVKKTRAKSAPARIDTFVIGNGLMAKRLVATNGTVRPLNYEDMRTNGGSTFFTPQGNEAEEFIIHLDSTHVIKASDLKLFTTDQSTETKGYYLRLGFAPIVCKGVMWKIGLVYTMDPNKHYIRKHLDIAVPDTSRAKAVIDYIDLFHEPVATAEHTWTHPEMKGGVGGLNGYFISLGQPIYINGMFFGCEFPATENEISNGIAHVRYYSGKSFEQLKNEDHLNNGVLSTWDAVIGATRSTTDRNVIQSDFFSYIDDIATASPLRIQYNSWYDFMLNIDESNILTAFKNIEKGLTQNGVPPIDSYVVDDGWNAYGDWKESNTTGFWQFNNKFPNGLTKPAGFAHNVASNFGLWLGPRGGYNFNYEFAQFLEKNGNGKLNKATYDICTNHKVYLAKLKDFFLDCQKKYDINYWKWDGFMLTPPAPDPQKNYISGGAHGMYYVTEHWERWIDICKAVRANSAKDLKMWINLTCYMNPSPWYLQWANSVWLQNSADMGRINTGLTRDVDQMLSYRDDRYFDFVNVREFQFPLGHVYNHDPIFGVTGSNLNTKSLTDEEFRTYLYMMATRGNAFWELYYSNELLTEGDKWLVNARALNWLKENYHILRHAKLIGTTPAKGNVYGYSSWERSEGIISVRNASAEAKSFEVTLDRIIGLPEGLKGLHRTTVLAANSDKADDNSALFNYGDKITLTLQPGEARIWRFSTKVDTKAPSVTFVNCETPNKVRVEFSEQIKDIKPEMFKINGGKTNILSARLLADCQTVEILTKQAVKVTKADNLAQQNDLTVSGVKDLSDNTEDDATSFVCYKYRQVFAKKGQVNAPLTSKAQFYTSADFGVKMNINALTTAENIFTVGDDVKLSVDAEGYLNFTVCGLTVKSKTSIADGASHAIGAVREKNGMVKLYVDGDINASTYDAKVGLPLVHAANIAIASSHVADFELQDKAYDYTDFKSVSKK